MPSVIRIKNLSKQYRLGTLGYGMLYKDLQSWWARLRKKQDPNTLLDESYGGNSLEREESGDGRFWALKDVSLDVKQGEVIGIIGRNGAGKSTLLKIITRITAPTAGSIKLKGRVASLLEVGTGFHPELTGRENVFLNGAILGMNKKEIAARMDEIIDFAGVEKFIDTPVKRYSSGMYVRLAFAVAAHLEPDVLLVDEVLAVGDAEFQKKCIGKMQDVSKRGRTVFFVSHNMLSVQQLCSRVVWMERGQIREDGETETTVSKYLADLTSGNLANVGNKYIDIRRVVVRNSAGQETRKFNSGDSLIVELHFTAKMDIKKPNFKVNIKDNGSLMLAANMLVDLRSQDLKAGESKIVCKFDYLPLLPRKYVVSISIRAFGGTEFLMREEDIASIQIVSDADKQGLDAKFALKSYGIFVPYEWSMPDGSNERVSLSDAHSGVKA